MAAVFLYWSVIYGVWTMGLYVIQRFDRPKWRVTKRERWTFRGCGIINAIFISGISGIDCVGKVFLAVLAGCLLFACVTDYKECQVYQFTWWVAGIAGVVLLLRNAMECDRTTTGLFFALLFFCALQELFFCKMYGRADCHAFVVCALAECSIGMGLREYLMHMLFAFGGLAIVQAFRHNINHRGNLKRPVAFLPYITFSFWINFCCFSLGKMIY